MVNRFDKDAFEKLEFGGDTKPEFVSIGSSKFVDVTRTAIPGGGGLFRTDLSIGDESHNKVASGDVICFRTKTNDRSFFATIYANNRIPNTKSVNTTLLIYTYEPYLNEKKEVRIFGGIELNSFPPRITDALLQTLTSNSKDLSLRSSSVLFGSGKYLKANLSERLKQEVYCGYYFPSESWLRNDLQFKVLRRNYNLPLDDMTTLQSPGESGWRGAIVGTHRKKGTRYHGGWDLHAPIGSPVYAVVKGVATSSKGQDFGNFVTLVSSEKPELSYVFAHLSSVARTGKVMPGDIIGFSGTTGNAEKDKPHLHFEVKKSNIQIDPSAYFTRPTLVVEQVGTRPTPILGWQ